MLASVDPDYPEAPAPPQRPAGHTDVSLAGRRFLIVTAPFGPFGRVLSRVLRGRGAEVSRMIFNAGDLLYGRDAGNILFKADARHWPRRLAELSPAFTDILIFGEGGAYNQGVLSQAAQLDARVWVLENGYFRPDWVTVERGGVNASSRLPRTRHAYAPPVPEIPVTRMVGRILPHHVVNISLYHLIQLPGRFLYPRFVAPYTQAPWLQCAGHIRRYIGLAFRSRQACNTDEIAARGPFFLACLQREGDAQLLRYSHFADNVAFMAEIMSSFARHAPADCRLVVKNHPLDPGLVDLAHMTRCLAIERGIADRVDFIDGGNLATLCKASRGMVVNNSSAALSALGFRTPVKVLGEAFFDFDGLTDQRPLNLFWDNPQGPDPDLFTRFRAHVIARTQVNGNYHEPRALLPTAQGIVSVLGRDV
ncbi:MAG: capsular biosynthesis protein [Alphaproteobacteria bacterium]|nr:MAG: capsular biosynthesis protein [Alphaproteobacteria bacterium]PZO34196.1 MAG: capsular biosynthesis protein [Alphaproteobacteria bacterium]